MVRKQAIKDELKYYYVDYPHIKETLLCIYYPHNRCYQIDRPTVDMDKPCTGVMNHTYAHQGKIELCTSYKMWWDEGHQE